MPNLFNNLYFELLTDKQKVKLFEYFDIPKSTATAKQIAALLKVQREVGYAMLSVLKDSGICDIEYLAYHNCNLNFPVSLIPYGAGFPDPFICPHCRTLLMGFKGLSLDIAAISKAQ